MSEAAPQPSGPSRAETGVPARPSSTIATLAIAVIIVSALYIAHEIFVPLALAILLSFALGPLVQLLRRCWLGRVPSIVAAVGLAFLVIFGTGALIGGQLVQLADNLPRYRTNIIDKIQALRGSTTGDGLFGRTSAMLKDLGTEIAKMPSSADSRAPSVPPALPPLAQQKQPLPVEIHQPEPTALQILQSVVGPLLQPLATTGMVIVFVIFFLLQREDLRDRFIRLAGARDLQRTTQALDDAGSRLSRYLLTQIVINSSFGVLIGSGLYLIGIPNALLWGIVAMLLRFVPYIGPVIAALFPAALAVAIDPGWSMLLWTVALFLAVEPVMGQILEPYLYGRSTGLSAVAIIIAAAFWTWLWGPIGLLLSTPLTLCLVVLGRHVEHLKFLDVVFGDTPALTPEEAFYQRILADDPDEAAYHAERLLKERTLAAYYDEVAIKGLALAQGDVNRGVLDHARRVQLKSAVDDIIDDLSDHDDPLLDKDESPPATDQDLVTQNDGVVAGQSDSTVICVAGRGSLDEAAAAMLAQLLTRKGLAVQVVPSAAVSAANIFHLDVRGVRVVCLSYLEAGGFTSARYLVRRLRRRLPHTQIIVGFWTLNEDDVARLEALQQTGADFIVTSLQQAVQTIGRAAASGISMAPAVPGAGIVAAE